MTMKDDLANRSTEIRWPAGFSPAEADLFSSFQLKFPGGYRKYSRSICFASCHSLDPAAEKRCRQPFQ